MKPLSNGFLLSDEELATLWHPATQTARAPTMRTNDSRELEAPTNIGSGKGAGDLTPGDLMCLPRYIAYCRLLVDGMPSKPFSMQTLPPIGKAREDRTDIVRRVSRRRYARPLAQVTTELEAQLAASR